MTFYSLIGIVVTSATVVIFGEPAWDPVQVIARSLKTRRTIHHGQHQRRPGIPQRSLLPEG